MCHFDSVQLLNIPIPNCRSHFINGISYPFPLNLQILGGREDGRFRRKFSNINQLCEESKGVTRGESFQLMVPTAGREVSINGTDCRKEGKVWWYRRKLGRKSKRISSTTLVQGPCSKKILSCRHYESSFVLTRVLPRLETTSGRLCVG